MTKEQCAAAAAILNCYAHAYLGLSVAQVVVAGAGIGDRWVLIVSAGEGAVEALDFDSAKALVDRVKERLH